MDEVIKNICDALKETAEAVISYTDRISSTSASEGMGATAQAFALIRLNEVEHIQDLTIELTKVMSAGALPASAIGLEEGGENGQ